MSSPIPARRPAWEDLPDPPLSLPTKTFIRPDRRPGQLISDKVAVLANRHASGQSLWHPDDLGPERPCDAVLQLAELGRFMHQLDLASRGLGWLANSISTVPGAPGEPCVYRAQVWDPNVNDHIEIGRAKTYGAAFDLIVAWAARALGVDVRFRPPEWLRLCLADAMRPEHLPEEDDDA